MSRANLQIAVGSYTGSGADDRNISGVGFRPDLVLVKGGANIAQIMTNVMPIQLSSYVVGATANGANLIQEILNDGFQVGTGANVNANGTTYYYIAIRDAGSNLFKTGKYVGDSSDNRNYTGGGLNFTPDITYIKGDTAQHGAARFGTISGDNGTTLSISTGSSNQIQNFQTNGWQLGTNARVNSTGLNYYWFAMKSYTGIISTGTFTGDGLDSKAITGVGFSPDVVIVKNRATSDSSVLRTSLHVGDDSSYLTSTANAADLIQSLDSDGFTVGTTTAVNGSGNAIDWIALKAGSHILPITRTAA